MPALSNSVLPLPTPVVDNVLAAVAPPPHPCGSPATEAEQSKRRRSQLADRISNKLHALFWVVVGVAVVYHTDFVRVLVEDERVDR